MNAGDDGGTTPVDTMRDITVPDLPGRHREAGAPPGALELLPAGSEGDGDRFVELDETLPPIGAAPPSPSSTT